MWWQVQLRPLGHPLLTGQPRREPGPPFEDACESQPWCQKMLPCSTPTSVFPHFPPTFLIPLTQAHRRVISPFPRWCLGGGSPCPRVSEDRGQPPAVVPVDLGAGGQSQGLVAFWGSYSPLGLKYPESCHRRSGKCPPHRMWPPGMKNKLSGGTEKHRTGNVTSGGETW